MEGMETLQGALAPDTMPCCDFILGPWKSGSMEIVDFDPCDVDFTSTGHAVALDFPDQKRKYRDLCPATCAAMTK